MFNSNNQYNPGGFVYGQQKPIKMQNPLTDAQIAQLKQRSPRFTIKLTEEEMLRAICTHKEHDQIVVQTTADGKLYCPICGEVFSEVNATKDEIQEAADTLTDILQNIKLNFIDIPAGMTADYFNIIPLIKKIPGLWQIALDNFSKYEPNNAFNQGQDMRGFNILGAMMNPAFTMVPQAQQGYAPQGYAPQDYTQAQQGYAPQGYVPMYNPATMGNPFGYQQQGYAPAQNMQQDNQTQPQQAPAQAPTAGAPVVNTKVVNV